MYILYIMYNIHIYICIIYICVCVYAYTPNTVYPQYNELSFTVFPSAVAFTLQSGLFSVGIDNRGIFFTVLSHRKTKQLWHSSERNMVNVLYLLIMFGFWDLFWKHAIVHSSERRNGKMAHAFVNSSLFSRFYDLVGKVLVVP